MKRIAFILLSTLPSALLAQPPGGMNQGDMQGMMAQMQKMQACMAQIDQSEIDALQQQGQRMESEINSLCAAGKRDEAQRKAISYGMQIAQSPSMKTLRECTRDMQAMMAQMPMPQMPYQDFSEDSQPRHVCDGL